MCIHQNVIIASAAWPRSSLSACVMYASCGLILLLTYCSWVYAVSLFTCAGLQVAAQRCTPRFSLHPDDIESPQRRVVFTGFTPEEKVANGNIDIGHRLICTCAEIEGLTPRRWLDINGNVVPSNMSLLVDSRPAHGQPGTAVTLHINNDSFSCAEAGTYTCVVGTNIRTVLVTPFGEWAVSIVMESQW